MVLLYLAAYAAAAAGLLLPVFHRRRTVDARTQTTGRFLQTIAVTGIIPPLQVILGALGILESLPGIWPRLMNVILNSLIITGIWGIAIGWRRMSRAFSPAPWFSDRFNKPIFITATVLTGANIPVQAIAVFREGFALNAADIALLILVLYLAAIALESTIRIYRPSPGSGYRGSLIILKVFLPTAALFELLFDILPEPYYEAVPPMALLAFFAMGIVLHIRQSDASDDPEAARDTLFDDAGMTPREREIALMLAEGLSYKEISEKLFISLSTIQTHVTRIYGKMDVRSKTELSRKIGG